MELDFRSRGRSLDINVPNELTTMPAGSHAVFNPAKQCLSPTRPSLPSVSSVMKADPSSYSLDSCIQDNFGPVQLRNYPQAVCRNQNAPHEQLVASSTHNKSPVMTMPVPFDTRDSDVKGKNTLEAQTQQKYGLQEMLP